MRLNTVVTQPEFIYTYTCQEDEVSLCHMEMRSLFGMESSTNVLKSPVAIAPDRSPFIKERIEVMYEGDELADILAQVEHLALFGASFKVMLVKINDLDPEDRIRFKNRRAIEREIGMHINGEADMLNPDHLFGLITMDGRWYFGNYVKAEAIWLHHMKKPRNYSIALSTRVARAVANIAVPTPHGVKAIDPCCGIGTVLVEALSMGINIEGRDINPFIVQGARQNIEHFGLQAEITLGDIADIDTTYDVAVLDMPYNLFSKTTPEEQFSLLKESRRIASKVVVVTIETIDEMIENAGLTIVDRCVAKKGNFSRQIIVCK
ncbi:MAG: methyltransferase domain-containing protein [Gorillibacterium sp.]|nr:methyltransferase domain-containing protein [Gorillibacterium sp.]